ncbi:MAG TPA: histidine kinase dimerization/phospho-acceptor domain-containing protein [Gemmatimonadaceae bacterium]
MKPLNSSPPRSWRAALVVACLAGTTVVCAILASEVRQADAALQEASARTLRDYATTAGRVLGTEAIRRDNDFHVKLFGPLNGTVLSSGAAPPLPVFAQRAESLYAAEKFPPDPLRGYLRVDLRTRKWDGANAMSDTARARLLIDTIFDRIRTGGGSAAIRLPGVKQRIILSTVAVADSTGHHYVYAVTQTRATNFQHAMRMTMETIPLLPPSFTGTAWNMKLPGGAANRPANDSLIGVRITAADGSLLYASPHWYPGPYQGSYSFQSGPDGFVVETVLRSSLASRLVPAVVRTAGKSVYIGFGLVACFLLAVSLIAFWGEMSHQTSERARSMEQLTTGLRHELNNALASVMLESQMLAASEDASPDARYAGAAIAEQAERMRKVIRRLDNVDRLPVVSYFEGKSMIDLTEENPPNTARAG